MEYDIKLNSIDEIVEFVNAISKIESDIDAIYQRQIFDAKSLKGIATICANHIITVRLISDNRKEFDEFTKICRKYEVE